ncbi:MAG: serine O-acetyltransferase [Jatrophihabitantaceae bacterium]
MSAPTLVQLIRQDIEASTHANFRLYSDTQFWTRALGKLLVSPSVRAVVTFRIGHALAGRGLLAVALFLRGRSLGRSGAEIHPLATIGPALHLVHSSGVVIGPDVVIGARARIHQGVTVGGPVHRGAGHWASARIGDDVSLGAHAVVLGDLTIGDGAVVGANAVVTGDVAAGAHVAGVPARPL